MCRPARRDIGARIAAPLARFIQEPALAQRLRDIGAVVAKPKRRKDSRLDR